MSDWEQNNKTTCYVNSCFAHKLRSPGSEFAGSLGAADSGHEVPVWTLRSAKAEEEEKRVPSLGPGWNEGVFLQPLGRSPWLVILDSKATSVPRVPSAGRS